MSGSEQANSESSMQQTIRGWCHVCNTPTTAFVDTTINEYKCPVCQTTFVEELTEDSATFMDEANSSSSNDHTGNSSRDNGTNGNSNNENQSVGIIIRAVTSSTGGQDRASALPEIVTIVSTRDLSGSGGDRANASNTGRVLGPPSAAAAATTAIRGTDDESLRNMLNFLGGTNESAPQEQQQQQQQQQANNRGGGGQPRIAGLIEHFLGLGELGTDGSGTATFVLGGGPGGGIGGIAGAIAGGGTTGTGAQRFGGMTNFEDFLHHVLMNENSHAGAPRATQQQIDSLPRHVLTVQDEETARQNRDKANASTSLSSISTNKDVISSDKKDAMVDIEKDINVNEENNIDNDKNEKQEDHNKSREEPLLGECYITQEPFEIGDIMVTLPCTHAFKEEAIVTWLEMHKTCPVCRETLPDTVNSSTSSNSNSNNSGVD